MGTFLQCTKCRRDNHYSSFQIKNVGFMKFAVDCPNCGNRDFFGFETENRGIKNEDYKKTEEIPRRKRSSR